MLRMKNCRVSPRWYSGQLQRLVRPQARQLLVLQGQYRPYTILNEQHNPIVYLADTHGQE